MNNQIKILPETITNKIAAGEVIQRPASVVKELLENAIDAKAKNIFINVKGSGKRFIQITDDGIGMSEDDAMVAFERHATSKIYLYEDLDSLKTLGFRGEALASIAAIASVDLRTKKPESQEGTQVIIEGGKVKKVQPIGSVNGTSITVKNLFFYTPARRHFLKSRNTEFRHILNVVKRYAIAFPDIEYKFHHDDKRIYHVQRVDASSRLEEILGKQLFVHSIHFEEESDGIKIHGYLGKPKYSRRTRGDQYIFLNSRWIVSRTLNHAVYSAYGELIKKSDFPYYVLFIELNPNQVDVNVHPTKMEVKFRDEKRVYNFIYGVVRKNPF